MNVFEKGSVTLVLEAYYIANGYFYLFFTIFMILHDITQMQAFGLLTLKSYLPCIASFASPKFSNTLGLH